MALGNSIGNGFKAIGNAFKWLSYHGSTGGLRNAGHSVGLAEEASHFSQISNKSLMWRTPLAICAWPVNAAAHVFGGTVKGMRNVGGGYINLWKNHPGKMALGTAVVGIPVAMSMIAANRKNGSHDHEADMRQIDESQQQNGQMLGLLQATESPVPARQDFSSLQQANPQIMAADSAMPEGRVAGPAMMQGFSA